MTDNSTDTAAVEARTAGKANTASVPPSGVVGSSRVIRQRHRAGQRERNEAKYSWVIDNQSHGLGRVYAGR